MEPDIEMPIRMGDLKNPFLPFFGNDLVSRDRHRSDKAWFGEPLFSVKLLAKQAIDSSRKVLSVDTGKRESILNPKTSETNRKISIYFNTNFEIFSKPTSIFRKAKVQQGTAAFLLFYIFVKGVVSGEVEFSKSWPTARSARAKLILHGHMGQFDIVLLTMSQINLLVISSRSGSWHSGTIFALESVGLGLDKTVALSAPSVRTYRSDYIMVD